MANKRILFLLLAAALIGTVPVSAKQKKKKTKTEEELALEAEAAAAAAARDYYIRPTEEGGEEFVQRLTWEQQEDILYYEVIIERAADDTDSGAAADGKKNGSSAPSSGDYVSVQNAKTEQNSFEVSLAAGKYRYRIIVYNLLEQPETQSDWMYFDIIKAYEPEVRSVTPATIYLDEENDGRYTITGTNLFTDSIYSLRPRKANTDSFIGLPISIDDKNRKTELQFDVKTLDVGVYNMTVTNPGGLTAQDGPVTIKYRKMVDLDISAGYTLPVILYDDTLKKYFDQSIWPLAATARIEFMPFKHRWGYLGISANAWYFYMSHTFDTYSVKAHTVTGALEFVYQLPLYKRAVILDVHGGAGVMSFLDMQFTFENNIKSDPLNSLNICATGGIALQVYPLKRLYVEVGCDYAHAFMKNMSTGMVLPEVSAGWQF